MSRFKFQIKPRPQKRGPASLLNDLAIKRGQGFEHGKHGQLPVPSERAGRQRSCKRRGRSKFCPSTRPAQTSVEVVLRQTRGERNGFASKGPTPPPQKKRNGLLFLSFGFQQNVTTWVLFTNLTHTQIKGPRQNTEHGLLSFRCTAWRSRNVSFSLLSLGSSRFHWDQRQPGLRMEVPKPPGKFCG